MNFAFQKSNHAIAAAICIGLATSWHFSAGAASKPETATIVQVRDLLDIYYGDSSLLIRAQELLTVAINADPNDANAFIQQARLEAFKWSVSGRNEPAKFYAIYGGLLKKALEIDPANATAHVNISLVYAFQKDFAKQQSELIAANALEPNDPWLAFELGNYCENINDLSQARHYYETIEKLGPGKTASSRKAYIYALKSLWPLRSAKEDETERLRKYAALILKERYPTDGWVLEELAKNFADRQLFEEAISYSREALKTMNFGKGRQTLMVSLYGKAAQEILAKRSRKEVQHYIDEANSFGFSRAQVIRIYDRYGFGDELNVYYPTLDQIIPENNDLHPAQSR
ncbi:MAG: hypothetical protein Q7R66_07755 [Undibacterium sp.]|uniref:tetratricopeptide repeat protein n=1 Tax=Undibacterium sp. TaxID=1914977 RepID=UPI002725EAC4|nr:hypothetical protein [Undibacterium sp.]MDO8652068.1 hypothetical protein [Undibacterium sp.]